MTITDVALQGADLLNAADYPLIGPGSLPPLKIEVLGDSITAGFAAHGSASNLNSDQYASYVRFLAQKLETQDWRVVARSGIGAQQIGGDMPLQVMDRIVWRTYCIIQIPFSYGYCPHPS